MSEQLSTVQQLWRDRREEFEAYLNGEMTCHNSAGEYLSTPVFDFDGSMYQFRPLPKPPKLRPWNASELWEHRDCWFRTKSVFNHKARPSGFDGDWMFIGLQRASNLAARWSPDEVLEYLEYLDANGQWQPCGIEVTE